MSDIELFGTIYEKGDVICRQDEPGDTMYVIQSGVIEISRHHHGKKIVLALLEKGEFFGEMALFDNRPRSATATAITRTRLLSVGKAFFLDRTHTDASTILEIIRALCQRIEDTNRLLRSKVASDDTLRAGLAAPLEERVQVDSDTPGEALSEPDHLPSENTAAAALPSVPPTIIDDGDLPAVHFNKGDTIFREGDEGQEMFVVAQGEVDIFTEAGDHRIPLVRLGPTAFFGEMALATGNPRTATAVATEETRLLIIDWAHLTEKVRRQPELALFIIQVLIARLRDVTAALENPERAMGMVRQLLPPVLKKKTRARVAVISLSSCGGCEATLIQSRDALTALSEIVDIVYCPMLMDAESFDEVDIALVTGAVRMGEDEHLLHEARQKSRFLVAWGTCAAFGGLPAMANLYELEELFDESFGQTTDPFAYYMSGIVQDGPAMHAPGGADLLRKVRKVDDIVRVDYYLPGCPPKLDLFRDLVTELRGEKEVTRPKGIVCAECPRKPKKNGLKTMGVFPEHHAADDVCLVSQGALCLGLMTRGGCGASCVRGGLPCWGCRGPTNKALKEIHNGEYYEELISAMLTRRTKLEGDGLRNAVRTLRQRGGSTFCFENNYVKDLSRLR